jgi:predicted DNA-binding transcriptional regulator YafY
MPSKRGEDTYGAKLIKLFNLLMFSHKPLSTNELTERLDCSKQTVARLIRDLEYYYRSQISDDLRGREKVYRLKPSDRPRHIELSDREMDALWIMREVASKFLGDDHNRLSTEALGKAQVALAKEKKDPDELPHIAHILSGTIDYTPHQDIITTLIEAINKTLVCKITYKAVDSTTPKSYHIKPLKLFLYRETLYLHAKRALDPLKKDGPKNVFDPILAIHRFKSAEIESLERTFYVSDDYDFDDAFNRTFGIIRGEGFTVEAELTGWAAKYVSERKWAGEQNSSWDGAKYRITFEAASEPEVISWIMSFAPNAKLLSPKYLVDKIAEIAEEVRSDHA